MESLVNYESDDGDAKLQKSYENLEPSKSTATGRTNRAGLNTNLHSVNMDVSDEKSYSSRSSSESSRSSPKRSEPRERDRRTEAQKRSLESSKWRERSRDNRSRSRERNRTNKHESRNRNFNGRDGRSNRNVRSGRTDIDNKSDRRDDNRNYDRNRKDRNRMDFDRNRRHHVDSREEGRDRNRGRHWDNTEAGSSFASKRKNYSRRSSPHRKRNDGDRQRDRHRDDDSNLSHRNDSPKKKDGHRRSPSPKNRSSRELDHASTGVSSTSSDPINKPAPRLLTNPNIEFLSRNQRRVSEKVQQLQKMGIEIPNVTTINPLPFQLPSTETTPSETADVGKLDLANFKSPVLVNQKYTEQNQKKKLIWGSKKVIPDPGPSGENKATNNKWESATFSHDSDGKVASKFLRLMGMKGEVVPKSTSSGSDNDADPNVKKREEMFSSMEQQYEVARQATHTMRGMGLGFASQPRSF